MRGTFRTAGYVLFTALIATAYIGLLVAIRPTADSAAVMFAVLAFCTGMVVSVSDIRPGRMTLITASGVCNTRCFATSNVAF
jgi:hypothetical protein